MAAATGRLDMMTTSGPFERIGDYVIEAPIDGGYLGVHVLLPRRALIRVGARGATAMQVMREACILEALRIPGVPRVFETGVFSEQGVSRPWAALEVVSGPSLLELASANRLNARDVLVMLREVAGILAHAHLRGVAHRMVRPDAIVRCDRDRGSRLCLIEWGDATVSSSDDCGAFADDVFALGLCADDLLATRAMAPPRLASLIDEMRSPSAAARPSAAQVAARAKALLATLEDNSDDDIVEEQVVLVDIIARTKTPPVPMPQRTRPRWTPQIGLPQVPSAVTPQDLLRDLAKRSAD